MKKLTLKHREKRALELEGGAEVRIFYEDGSCDGEPLYNASFRGCAWAEIVAIGRALAPEGLSAMEHEQAVREVEVVEPEEEGEA